jgi:N-acetylmuramoyl-L-alanine amidase
MSSLIKNGKHSTFNIYVVKLILVLSASILLQYMSYALKNDKGWVIVIDAGHGGKDPGALGAHSEEKNITLPIALKTGEYIERNIKNVTVIYTRKNDTFVELKERPNIANRNKADLFISIHANSAPSKSIMGAETYVMGMAKDQQNLEVAMKENNVILMENDYSTKYEGFDPKSPESYIMFSLTQKIYQEQSTNLATKIQKQFREKVERYDRDVKQAGFWVLFATSMPSVLIETGFITNEAEEKFLNSNQGQDYLASSIYMACREYIDEIDSKSGISWSNIQSHEPETNKSDSARPSSGEIKFRIQVANSSVRTEIKPENFNGYSDITEIVSKDRFKYALGDFSDYAQAVEYRKKIEAVYPDAFIIAVKDNKILPLQQALDKKKRKIK